MYGLYGSDSDLSDYCGLAWESGFGREVLDDLSSGLSCSSVLRLAAS